MSRRFDACVAEVLKHEGGFVDHPADPGGVTNHGISLRYARTLGSMLDLDKDGDVDRDDIVLVTPEKAAIVYENWFWKDVRGEQLPAGVDLVVFDFAVNSGTSRAIRALQEALGVPVDGVFGPQTLNAVVGADALNIVNKVCDIREKFLRSLRTWPTFGNGWMRRVDSVRTVAVGMVGDPRMTVREATQTDTGRAAITTTAVGAVVTAAVQAEPALKALGSLTPWVAIAVVVAVLVGVLVWRTKR